MFWFYKLSLHLVCRFLFLFCLSLCDGTGWLFCSCHDVVMLLYRIRYKQLQLVSNCARARAVRSFVLVNVVSYLVWANRCR